MNKCGVVIVNYNNSVESLNLAKELNTYKYIEHIVIVDNDSSDDSYNYLTKSIIDKVEVIITEKNGGYGYGNNQGIYYLLSKYSTKYVMIANPDVHFSETTCKACIDFLTNNPKYAVVAPRMLNENNSNVDNSSWMIPTVRQILLSSLALLGRNNKFTYPQINKKKSFVDCECVAGSLLMINLQLFQDYKIYDENILLYCEETVLGIKVRDASFLTAMLVDSSFVHDHSTSIDLSVSKKYRQTALLWKSRIYVLDNYYGINHFTKILAIMISKICIIETYLWELFKIR